MATTTTAENSKIMEVNRLFTAVSFQEKRADPLFQAIALECLEPAYAPIAGAHRETGWQLAAEGS
jgi:hypothetical protein